MNTIRIHHSTSQPYRFFGREAELAMLDEALARPQTSLVALVGPGGQGKTAIVQHWLESFAAGARQAEGVFLWSFYRGKDVDGCLRELYAFAAGLEHAPEVSAPYCVDHTLPVLRERRLVIVLDGAEVVQYESGPWFGRFVHPELGRLLEEAASAPLPGVIVLTTRFPLPELERRPCARLVHLAGMDAASARALLRGVGVRGSDADLDKAADWCGRHAKAVELLGTLLVHYFGGEATRFRSLPDTAMLPGSSDEEHKVTRVLAAYRNALTPEAQDLLALATAFRDPPTTRRLLEYAASAPVESLLHEHWGRTYEPFRQRSRAWLAEQLETLIHLRLLERVGLRPGLAADDDTSAVIDAHPLVRRSFENVLGAAGQKQSAAARAGFLHGRPDRRLASTLDEAREDIEMFHAYCDAGLWEEADRTLVALDRPRYRFLAPALERELLLRFFPEGDWHRRPLWPGFRHWRALAICLELLGSLEDAVAAYRDEDAPLRGDALLALGRLAPLLAEQRPPHPWQMLWQSYRAHALCLAGRTDEALRLAGSLVPMDVYEWTHLFEALLRLGRLDAIDMHSFLYRPPRSTVERWNELARQRMKADYLRLTGRGDDLGPIYEDLLDSYDRGGLPYERALTRLSYARWLLARGENGRAREVSAVARELGRRYRMRIVEADACEIVGDPSASQIRHEVGYSGPGRP